MLESNKLKRADFVLRDEKDLTQGDLESWQSAVRDIGGGSVEGMTSLTFQRATVEGAVASGWYAKLPDGFTASDVKKLRPNQVRLLSDEINSVYNRITEPSDDFF